MSAGARRSFSVAWRPPNPPPTITTRCTRSRAIHGRRLVPLFRRCAPGRAFCRRCAAECSTLPDRAARSETRGGCAETGMGTSFPAHIARLRSHNMSYAEQMLDTYATPTVDARVLAAAIDALND